eukprot:3717131-Rhodomonas_salina.5
MPMVLFGGFSGGYRAQRAAQGQVTKQANLERAAEWAAGATNRPFKMVDLHDASKFIGALRYFESLHLVDVKSECAMNGLPVTGSKDKLIKALRPKPSFWATLRVVALPSLSFAFTLDSLGLT